MPSGLLFLLTTVNIGANRSLASHTPSPKPTLIRGLLLNTLFPTLEYCTRLIFIPVPNIPEVVFPRKTPFRLFRAFRLSCLSSLTSSPRLILSFIIYRVISKFEISSNDPLRHRRFDLAAPGNSGHIVEGEICVPSAASGRCCIPGIHVHTRGQDGQQFHLTGNERGHRVQ